MTTTQTRIKGTAIQNPTGTMDNHTLVLKQLKEVAEIGQRLRGDPEDSYIRVSELVNLGLVRLVSGTVQPAYISTTVGQLPSATPAGQRAIVTDATSTTFATTVSGGGTNVVPVYSTGSAWKIG